MTKTNKPCYTFTFVLLAGGLSVRFGSKKELVVLPGGQTPLHMVLQKVVQCSSITQVHLVYHPNFQEESMRFLHTCPLPYTISEAGATRQLSVLGALRSLRSTPPDFVLIHDGARPWFSCALLQQICQELPKKQAIIPAITATESVKMINEQQQISAHIPRASLVIAQTPQAFAFAPLLDAHEYAVRFTKTCTDDAEVWALRHKTPIFILPGEIENKKITFQDDIA